MCMANKIILSVKACWVKHLYCKFESRSCKVCSIPISIEYNCKLSCWKLMSIPRNYDFLHLYNPSTTIQTKVWKMVVNTNNQPKNVSWRYNIIFSNIDIVGNLNIAYYSELRVWLILIVHCDHVIHYGTITWYRMDFSPRI